MENKQLIDNLFNKYRPIQRREEMLWLLDKIGNPKTIVEIGVQKGGTLKLWEQLGETVIGIDTEDQIGWNYEDKAIFIKGDSHKIETKQKLEKILKGRKIDFFFQDADHSYEGVKKDFKMYKDLVDGIICYADIEYHPNREDVGVDRFWKEIKKEYKTDERIIPSSVDHVGCCGLGIIYV